MAEIQPPEVVSLDAGEWRALAALKRELSPAEIGPGEVGAGQLAACHLAK